MGQLRDRMDADLRLAGYSPSTCKIYLLYARQFAKHFMRSPAEMGEAEVRCFLLHLIEERQVSRQTVRQVRAALAFLQIPTGPPALAILGKPSRLCPGLVEQIPPGRGRRNPAADRK